MTDKGGIISQITEKSEKTQMEVKKININTKIVGAIK